MILQDFQLPQNTTHLSRKNKDTAVMEDLFADTTRVDHWVSIPKALRGFLLRS